MALSTPVEREFQVMRAGHIRDNVILANFREGLRSQVNPETGQPFTEEEIAQATAPGSTFYIEAQGDDDWGQGEQRNALYLADQIRVERASGRWLIEFHGATWGVTPLPATGGSGQVRAAGTPGSIIVGSTTIGDPNAHTARDPAGNLYQVFSSVSVPAGGIAFPTLLAVSTGTATNLPTGTVLTWATRPPGLEPTCEAFEDFRGGTDPETHEETASRIAAIIRHRPGAGNDSHWRTWAREASNAVEDAFVYPTALNNGSVIVCVTQKRGSAVGPNARVASAATLDLVRGQLTAPSSPVVPSRTFSLVVPVVPEPVDVRIRLSMQRASASGWRDAQPFPAYHAFPAQITSVSSQTSFQMSSPGDTALPGLAALGSATAPNAPKIMVWNETRSEWVELAVASMTHLGGVAFSVTLSSAPGITLVPGLRISPATPRAAIIARALSAYFDELGPGDFFDTTTDHRGGRCVRFPEFSEEWPARAGAIVVNRVLDALGATTADGELAFLSPDAPSLQPSLQLGPRMLTLGNVTIYDL